MLDKSVQKIPVLMKKDPGVAPPVFPLPEGFCYEMYQSGYEKDWARIFYSVASFESEMDALLYYQANFLPYGPELSRRCFFVVAPCKERIGTATAWWDYVGQRRVPLVHWVAVKPTFQGLGIGKALTHELLQLMRTIDGDDTFYLRTQTQSHKAIRLYEQAGFSIIDDNGIFGYADGRYADAINLLASIYKDTEERSRIK